MKPSPIVMPAAHGAILPALALFLLVGAALPAAAQVTLGTQATDPPRVEFGVGAFDITPSSSHKDSETAAEFRGEYHFGDVLWAISPFIGVSGTSDGGFYGYGGFGIDIDFGPNIVLTPTAAAGYFARGSGTNLGSWWEFRTGAELAWRLPNQSRIGIAVNHTSNAGLTRLNPGEQSVVLTYSLPLTQ
ncbi:MAG TPA: acyloxyacyl hydrolase [Stellaceae bacterium]|nr:acyloxyacyl hydrolase [Stellaceae bacterium]